MILFNIIINLTIMLIYFPPDASGNKAAAAGGDPSGGGGDPSGGGGAIGAREGGVGGCAGATSCCASASVGVRSRHSEEGSSY